MSGSIQLELSELESTTVLDALDVAVVSRMLLKATSIEQLKATSIEQDMALIKVVARLRLAVMENSNA